MTNLLEMLFGSRLRAKVLSWLYSHPDTRYYVRQLTSLIGEDSTNVSRELARLENAGILISIQEGKQKYYQANHKFFAFEELKNMVTRLATSPSDDINERLHLNKRKLADFCRLNHIQSLSLFGSILREDFKPESDIDVLVEFKPSKTPGFLRLADIEEKLSKLMGGRKVDLRTREDLSEHFRTRVLKEAKVLCR